MKKKYVTPENGKIESIAVHMDDLVPLMLERLNAGQTVEFSPTGTSMLPMLRQGIDCVILSSPPERLKKYDIPLYRRKNGKYILHRIVKVGETYTCSGDNQIEYESGIERDQIIAVVTAFRRKNKLHSVCEPLYRMYCLFLWASRPARRIWRGLRRRAAVLKRRFKNQ